MPNTITEGSDADAEFRVAVAMLVQVQLSAFHEYCAAHDIEVTKGIGAAFVAVVKAMAESNIRSSSEEEAEFERKLGRLAGLLCVLAVREEEETIIVAARELSILALSFPSVETLKRDNGDVIIRVVRAN